MSTADREPLGSPRPVPDSVDTVDLASVFASLVRCRQENAELRDALERAERKFADRARRRLLDWLQVVDAVERVGALSARAEAERTTTGVVHRALVQTRMLVAETLARHGVTAPELLGALVQPELVDVEREELDRSRAVGTVVEVMKAAYHENGTILRRGAVVVSTHTESRPS